MSLLVGLLIVGACAEDPGAPEPADAGEETGGGGEGADAPAAPTGPRQARLRGAVITLEHAGEASTMAIHLPVSTAQALPGAFELTGDPEGPRGTLTETGPPARVFEAMSGSVEIIGCASAVDELMTGRWDAIEFQEVEGDETRALEGDFEMAVVEVTDFEGVCGAPPDASAPEPPACALEPGDVCAGDAQPRCCTFRSGVDRCHAQCDLGACANPGFSGCLLCRQACIRNVVDAGCEDRYTRLGRCQFESGCVGSGDPSCTVDHCCDELAAALVTH